MTANHSVGVPIPAQHADDDTGGRAEQAGWRKWRPGWIMEALRALSPPNPDDTFSDAVFPSADPLYQAMLLANTDFPTSSL